jgi:hypothetical protein
MDSTDPSAAPTTFYTNAVPPAARPPSSMRLTHPAVATVDTGTRTATAVMAVATTAGTTTAVAAVMALLARPPSPLPLMVETARHG